MNNFIQWQLFLCIKVDVYLSKAKKWQEELEKLRMIILDCQLTEELKWGVPCYMFKKSNIVVIGKLKEYCINLGNYTLNTPIQQR